MWRTAEFVSPKHPDKICDRISDKVLDYCIGLDPNARVAIETMGGHGSIYVNGEITMKSTTTIPVPHLVEEVLETTDYLQSTQVNIVQQSPEISRGVDTGGAGDQGIMVGYACDENDEYVPEEYRLSRSLCRHLYDKFPYDGKTQVTTRDDRNIFVVTSFQNVDRVTLHNEVSEWLKTEDYGLMLTHANPAGDWTQGGFDADAGLTGRKLVVDNYGPRVPIGGGAYSGKDPSKVDRSAAYMARHIAVKELKRKGLQECYVYLSYAIGQKEPLQMTCTDGHGNSWDIPSNYPVYPNEIIEFLDLKKSIYYETANWGAYGNGFKWDE
jgi:S-adenosylmethionine synthetase|tara:strand:- start:514 stop:1488 length:975 start_codon:yes stop_codon:yes gene_type:complete